MLKHTNTYSKADLTDKQLSQEQKHGQQYFLDTRLLFNGTANKVEYILGHINCSLSIYIFIHQEKW